uniref:NADH-ubiquinone oxidoreductase chain 3 n=1 Tax=Aphelenchoides besseyi TaxID=269767 RepID=A0A088CQK5_9BILA|nr:NADH dehydrogenase subunit 3 [Aphelenchoides besseyi]AII79376.1 NADH dehydrogenase subunit 3 [Aphelenchoides besseyi]
MLFFIFLLGIFFIFLFFFLNYILSTSSSLYLKNSSFESGFLSIGKIQTSFSIHFFVVMLMFVIFDVEIVMVLGFILSDFSSLFIFFFVFLFILFGLYMEWFFMKLMWVF